MDESGRHRDVEMLEVWKSPETLAAIAAYAEKTIGKK